MKVELCSYELVVYSRRLSMDSAVGRLPCAGFSKFRRGLTSLILIFFLCLGAPNSPPPIAVPRILLRE